MNYSTIPLRDDKFFNFLKYNTHASCFIINKRNLILSFMDFEIWGIKNWPFYYLSICRWSPRCTDIPSLMPSNWVPGAIFLQIFLSRIVYWNTFWVEYNKFWLFVLTFVSQPEKQINNWKFITSHWSQIYIFMIHFLILQADMIFIL